MSGATRLSMDGLSQPFHALPRHSHNGVEHGSLESSFAQLRDVTAVERQTAKHHQRLTHLEKAFTKLEKRLGGLYEITRTSLGEDRLQSYCMGCLQTSAASSDTAATPHQDTGHASPTSSIDRCNSTEAVLTLPGTVPGIDSIGEALAVHAARLETIEATCGDLRHSVEDAVCMAESTERLMKAALDHEAGQLRHEHGNHRVQFAADLRRLEAAAGEATRRVQDIERRIEEARQDQVTNTNSLNTRMEKALRSMDEHSTEANQLHTLLKGELMQEMGVLRGSLGLKQTRQDKDVASVQMRLQEFERMQLQEKQPGTGFEASVAARLEQRLKDIVQPQLDMLLNNMTQCATGQLERSAIGVRELETRLTALEAIALRRNALEAAAPLATSSNMEHLKRSLVDTEKDMARLARNCIGVVEDPLSTEVSSASFATPSREDPIDVQRQLLCISTHFTKRLTTAETKFTSEFKHVQEMLTLCHAAVRAMQEEVQDLRPRIGSMEVQIVGLQLHTSSQALLQQQQQRLQQQAANMSPPGPTKKPDAPSDPASMLTNLKRLLSRGSQGSGASDATNTSQPAAVPVTIVTEERHPAAVPKPALQAQNLARLAVAPHAQPQDSAAAKPASQAQILSCSAGAPPTQPQGFSTPQATCAEKPCGCSTRSRAVAAPAPGCSPSTINRSLLNNKDSLLIPQPTSTNGSICGAAGLAVTAVEPSSSPRGVTRTLTNISNPSNPLESPIDTAGGATVMTTSNAGPPSQVHGDALRCTAPCNLAAGGISGGRRGGSVPGTTLGSTAVLQYSPESRRLQLIASSSSRHTHHSASPRPAPRVLHARHAAT